MTRRRPPVPAPRRRPPHITGAVTRLVSERPRWAALLLMLVAVVAWVYLRGTGDSAGSDGAQRAGVATATDVAAGTDQASGLPYVTESALPPEAKQVLSAIRAGGPFEFEQDGDVFGNFEGILPKRTSGYYHEYTVQMSGEHTRGAHRFVTGNGGEVYWTDDHYASFSVVKEGT
ncbi:ribonuclease domain-containing protein [Cumulibacter manganitolerans]|uniref:ribonuclease domain-containing protein n=1 Tax=Cumulibacter manganitolerans TaxID=1884992 RepID=UPI001E4F62E7|nr:ribonuclease domain-containing protein [Cumulibacter manganitolerans]